MKTIIHVNQHIIKSNHVNKENKPTLTVKTYKSNTYAHEVVIHGPSKVIYSPDKPLNCGARVWIETNAQVTAIDLNDHSIPELYTEEQYQLMNSTKDLV